MEGTSGSIDPKQSLYFSLIASLAPSNIRIAHVGVQSLYM